MSVRRAFALPVLFLLAPACEPEAPPASSESDVTSGHGKVENRRCLDRAEEVTLAAESQNEDRTTTVKRMELGADADGARSVRATIERSGGWKPISDAYVLAADDTCAITSWQVESEKTALTDDGAIDDDGPSAECRAAAKTAVLDLEGTNGHEAKITKMQLASATRYPGKTLRRTCSLRDGNPRHTRCRELERVFVKRGDDSRATYLVNTESLGSGEICQVYGVALVPEAGSSTQLVDVSATLARHRVPNMRASIAKDSVEKHPASKITFEEALDVALTRVLGDLQDGLPSVVATDAYDEIAEHCPGTSVKSRRGAALCLANRPEAELRLIPATAKKGDVFSSESPRDNWLFELRLSDFRDAWFFIALPNDGSEGSITAYN